MTLYKRIRVFFGAIARIGNARFNFVSLIAETKYKSVFTITVFSELCIKKRRFGSITAT